MAIQLYTIITLFATFCYSQREILPYIIIISFYTIWFYQSLVYLDELISCSHYHIILPTIKATKY